LRDWETGIERRARERVGMVKMPKTQPPGLGFSWRNVGGSYFGSGDLVGVG
jgi:hypothetical protein